MKSKVVFLFMLLGLAVYAQPGRDGAFTVSGTNQVLNKYCPVTTDIVAGTSTLTTLTPALLTLCPGDLIMVYQAQGATTSSVDAVGFGAITAYGSAGLYEFKYVQSVSGNTITTQTPFTNSYQTTGMVQVIRVPQYTTLTINAGAGITAATWKDTTAGPALYRFKGIVAVHAANIINNGIITATSRGFRGGEISGGGFYWTSTTLYVSQLIARGGKKGEGIAGYETEYDLNGGRFCRGAPANGGGGGSSASSGGGGGGNGFNGNTWTGQGVMIVNASNPVFPWGLDPGYIANGNALTNSSGGGRGGYSWSDNNSNAWVSGPGSTGWSGDFRREIGGLGGRPLTNINSESRIYFGGGGGSAQQRNNATPGGAAGGGIVYLVATSGITGAGTIVSGSTPVAISSGCNCDGSSGGGAGGSIIIKTPAIAATQVVNASGGDGGSLLTSAPPANIYESEGGGGGGSGGFVAISAPGVTPLVNGGLNGTTASISFTEFPANGTTQGATGQIAPVSTAFVAFTSVLPVYPVVNTGVCQGSALNFTYAPYGVTYSWSGPNGFTSALQNPTITNALPGMSGVYSATASSPGCVLTGTVTVTVSPQPAVAVTTASILCAGAAGSGTANLALTGGSGAYAYAWSGTSQTTPTVTTLIAGVQTVTITDLAGPCTQVKTFQINQPPGLTLTIAASSPSVCIGNSITLTATNLGGVPAYTYSWTGGPATSSYNTYQTTGGTYVYTVSSRDANQCLTTATIPLDYISNPVVSAPSVSVCPGVTGTLLASGAASYVWSPSGFSGASFNPSPVATTQYTVTGTSASGCTASTTASVVVNALPSITFFNSPFSCAGPGSSTVAAGGTGPFSYTWFPTSQSSSVATNLFPGTYTITVLDNGTGCTYTSTTTFTPSASFSGTLSASNSVSCYGATNGTAGIIVSGGSGTQTYNWSNTGGAQTASTAINLVPGTHTVTVVDALSFCAITKTFSIIQPLPLTLTISAASSTACTGVPLLLTAVNSGGTPGYTYTWSPGPNTSTCTALQLTGGTYAYSVATQDAGGCTTSKTISIIYITSPTLSVSNATLCMNANTTLSVSGASTYTWYPTGFIGDTYTVSPAASTVYTVTGKSSVCSVNAQVSVVVNPLPTAAFVIAPVICSDQDLVLNGSGTGSYVWKGPAGFYSTSQNTVIPHVTLAGSGTYSLLVTSANTCTALATNSVSVMQGPVSAVSGATVCVGEPAALNASGGTGYVWSGPNGFSSHLSSILIPVVSVSESYTVVVTGTNSCSTYSVVQLLANPFPLPTPTITANPAGCLNTHIGLKGLGGISYVWRGPAGFFSVAQDTGFIASRLNMSGIYTLSVKNADNCTGTSTVMITVYPSPTGSVVSSNFNFCVPGSSDFKFNPAVNIAPVTSSTFQIADKLFTGTTASYYFSAAGTYTVKVVFKDTNACANEAAVVINAYEKPTADFDFFPTNPMMSVDRVLFTNASSGSDQTTWTWLFANEQADTIKTKTAYHVFENAGNYAVAMIVKNKWGCADTMIKALTIGEEFSLYVPNSFTPNGDNVNDVFQPKGVNIQNYRLHIFDRWGQLVFESTDFYTGWNGGECTNDMYAWKIDVVLNGGKSKVYTGTVNLIR